MVSPTKLTFDTKTAEHKKDRRFNWQDIPFKFEAAGWKNDFDKWTARRTTGVSCRQRVRIVCACEWKLRIFTKQEMWNRSLQVTRRPCLEMCVQKPRDAAYPAAEALILANKRPVVCALKLKYVIKRDACPRLSAARVEKKKLCVRS